MMTRDVTDPPTFYSSEQDSGKGGLNSLGENTKFGELNLSKDEVHFPDITSDTAG